MSSPWKKKQPEVVAAKVLERAEMSRLARKLQSTLALASYKAKRGWEHLPLDLIEPKVEDQLRRRHPPSGGDVLSDSSSSTSDFQYPRALLSSPLKAPVFSDALDSSSGSSGHRKRTFNATFPDSSSSSASARKRFRSSPTAGRSIRASRSAWKDQHQLAQSSPIKSRKHAHFTTTAGPNISFFRGTSSNVRDDVHSFATGSEDDDDLLPIRSFKMPSMEFHSSPPRTPPSRSRASLGRHGHGANISGKSGEEGADLLLYLATSPSPAKPKSRMNPPSTPPSRQLALPSSMMNTPGGGGGGFLSAFGNPHTPNQGFDFADFVNITPSPAQNAWSRTPGTVRTPATIARRGLTFENFTRASPTIGSHSTAAPKEAGLGMQLGGNLIP
ncbi:MAG: hypothetical protein M1818_003164 [Claussenomyces sp. TS43310]|nr:MAG: hypothetical protein M1818_003164 [Claussenomyces sp. TS43310]